MYNTCKEAHIAVSEKIQQINANRQESIRPQYIDMALNEAVDILVTQKIKAFEETGRYYDDLQILKRTTTSPLFIADKDNKSRGFVELPFDYLHGVTYSADVIFDKFKRCRNIKNVGYNLFIINLDSLFTVLPTVKDFSINIGNITYTIYYPAKVYTKEGIFECTNYIVNRLRGYGLDVSYEKYHNDFYPHSLIIRCNTDTIISLGDDYTMEQKSFIYEAYSKLYYEITDMGSIPISANTKLAGLDLVSDVQRLDILQTYHNAKNRHIHPICTIEDNRLYVDMNDTFVITNVYLVYLKKPTYFNFLDNTATELPFKVEIINLAAQRLLGILKDNGYQISVNENNLLK